MRLPDSQKKIVVSNTSDLFGNIEYGKNINLDEPGYIKLASRVISLENQSRVANLRLPLAFGRKSQFAIGDSVDFAMTQSGQKGYWVTLLETGITFNPDVGTNAPTLTEDSHAAWYLNLWTVTSDTDLWTKASVDDVATYTDRGNLTSGKVHFVESFKSQSSVCVTNGDEVKQFNSSYTEIDNLLLPTDFEAIGLCNSNNIMGIVTMTSDSAAGQNQDANFFVWDGTINPPRSFPIGSDKCIAIASYMDSSFIILTRKGEIKQFNGGGWKTLTQLPFYYRKLIWGLSTTRELLGDVIKSDGSRIYINFNGIFNAHGKKYEQVSQTSPGGVLCFDPSIGIYNRYSPSISPASMIRVAQADVNTTTDIMTVTAPGSSDISGTIPPTGSQIKYVYDKTNLIGGLKTPHIYYVIRHTATTFSLAETYDDAISGTKINLTSTGATNNYFLGLTVYDYGATYTTQSGAMALMGKNSPLFDHFIFGAELNDYNSTGDNYHVMVTCPDFDNRGYFVTSKETTNGVTDTEQKVFVKYKPLKDTDSIIVKSKSRQYVGLPVSTPQANTTAVNQCTWLSPNLFTTTADLSDAKTAIDDDVKLECEVIAGAGAGTMTQISTIEYESGTYSVQLAEDVDGAASSRYCDVIIDNWEYKGTINSTDTSGYVEIGLGDKSTFYKLKVEMRGSDVTIEDIQPVKTPDKKSN